MPRDTSAASAASRAKRLAKHPDILTLVRRGVPAADIARRVGISTRTVSRVRGDAGLAVERRRATEDDKLFAKGLLEDGASYAEVSRTIGFGAKEIKRWFPGYTWDSARCGEAAAMARQLAEINWNATPGIRTA